MKKIGLFVVAIGVAVALTGCQANSGTSSNTDEADSALLQNGSAQGVNTPPVPPEPTRPSK